MMKAPTLPLSPLGSAIEITLRFDGHEFVISSHRPGDFDAVSTTHPGFIDSSWSDQVWAECGRAEREARRPGGGE